MNPLLKGKNFLLPLSAKTAITRAPQSKDPLNKTSTQTKAKPQNKPSEKSSENLSAVALCEGGTQPAEKKTHMKIKSNKSSSALTVIELVVVIAIIAILAALVVPAVTSALNKVQMTRTMNNARQLYLAQFQMANDGAATGSAGLAWPGDLITGGYLPGGSDLTTYANILLSNGYLRAGDAIKLFNAPGASFSAGINAGPPEQLIAPFSGAASIKVYPVLDSDVANAIFCVTNNYTYSTVLPAGGVPYGQNGFITVKKGGDAAIFRPGQAVNTNAPWPNATAFQNGVGLKTGDAVGTVTANDPGVTFHYP